MVIKKASIKNIKGAFKLPIQTVTFVPSTTKTNRKISAALMRKRVNETRRFLSKLFGGFTSTESVGGYVSKNKRLVKEKVVAVTAFATRLDFKRNKQKWIRFVKNKKREWSQEAMGVIIENDLFFIS